MSNKKINSEVMLQENEESKKKGILGIVIPEECGKAEKYEITAIMYHSDYTDAKSIEYKIFITEKDFENGTPFATIQANMNPEILLYPDEENEGIGCLEYNLVENEKIIQNDAGENAIVISNIVNDSESQWIMNVTDNSAYINVEAKTIREYCGELTLE